MEIGRFAFLRSPLGYLGATYDDHLRLIGKRIVDLILVSGDDHTLSCFRNTVDTLWTLTSSLGYITKTFIDAIMKLSTHTLNHGLTVITPLLYYC